MHDSPLEDVRASDPVERLLEDSWQARSRAASRRELIVEAGAAALFLAVAVPLAVPALAHGQLRPGLALLLVGLYAVVSRAVKFPIGAGYVVPSYLVLVPMLLMLPPTTVPVLAAAGLCSAHWDGGSCAVQRRRRFCSRSRMHGIRSVPRLCSRSRGRPKVSLAQACTLPRLLPGAHSIW